VPVCGDDSGGVGSGNLWEGVLAALTVGVWGRWVVGAAAVLGSEVYGSSGDPRACQAVGVAGYVVGWVGMEKVECAGLCVSKAGCG